MILLTVGSMFPFDRLVREVDELAGAGRLDDEVVAQIGDGRYEPRHMPFHRFLSRREFEGLFGRAERLVSHAGAGTIAMALQHGKRLLVVPRLARHGEHVNDHQIATARRFEELQHVLVAYELDQIPAQLQALRGFEPRQRVAAPQRLAQRIGQFLTSQLST
ncbi:glycosyltransferase [Azohydromonas aeria]|uniref:glycosyltransferase n=1 Tax=Azohydromonas aeria TaxID=2590212 RepID=UPI0012FAB3A2|nr:glycosyltransferase [Azohydromonas aeria]